MVANIREPQIERNRNHCSKEVDPFILISSPQNRTNRFRPEAVVQGDKRTREKAIFATIETGQSHGYQKPGNHAVAGLVACSNPGLNDELSIHREYNCFYIRFLYVDCVASLCNAKAATGHRFFVDAGYWPPDNNVIRQQYAPVP